MLKITQEQWDEWRDGYITQAYLNYVKDMISEDAEILLATMLAGEVVSEESQVKSAIRKGVVDTMLDIDLTEIEEFYHDRTTGESGNSQA